MTHICPRIKRYWYNAKKGALTAPFLNSYLANEDFPMRSNSFFSKLKFDGNQVQSYRIIDLGFIDKESGY